jgi:hypothetical protein
MQQEGARIIARCLRKALQCRAEGFRIAREMTKEWPRSHAQQGLPARGRGIR